MGYRKIASQLGREGLAVGRAGEERVLKAFLSLDLKNAVPSWWRGIRAATRDEDARGIDHVVHTDCGDLFLQIKTSLFKEGGEFSERNDNDVPIVRINLKDSDAEIRKRIIQVIGEERLKMMHTD